MKYSKHLLTQNNLCAMLPNKRRYMPKQNKNPDRVLTFVKLFPKILVAHELHVDGASTCTASSQSFLAFLHNSFQHPQSIEL